MENAILHLEKLLSHRLRGFSDFEHTPSALLQACASPVPYLEVDTRVSKDGKIYIYHNPQTGKEVSGSFTFAKTHAAQLDLLRFTSGEHLLTLKSALQCFQRRNLSNQILCLDIKDYGFEQEHLTLVRETGLIDQTFFVSWIPQTLLRLYELEANTPLILSHWNLFKWKRRGQFLTRLLENKIARLKHFVVIGRNQINTDLGLLSHGFQHTLICQEIPSRLLHILATSGGGICVHHSLLDKTLIAYCLRHSLKLWLFSAKTPHYFSHYAADPAVDVVFCDNAPAILNIKK